MLTAVFISRCDEPALSKTREILDAYAIRIGDQSWEAKITAEGLDTVRKALRKKASRKTAVCCHLIGRNKRNVAWIVGNRKKFSRLGNCPVRTTGVIHDALKTRRDFHGYPLVSALAEAAARAHDFGKANKFFQQKIRKSKILADPLRHEFLSVLLAKNLLTGGDITFEKAWEELKNNVPNSLESKSEFPITFPKSLLEMVQWLIVTHHKLPHYSNGKTICKAYISDNKDENQKENKKNREANLALQKHLPQSSVDSFKVSADNIQSISNIAEKTFSTAFMWARLAVMLGDHFASADEKIEKVKVRDDLIANSSCKQRLDAHIDGVAKMACRAVREIVTLTRKLPALYPEDRAEVERPVGQAKKDNLYLWQNDLANKVKTIVDNHNAIKQGFFGVLCADTGTGKTRAGIRLASILGGENMRISVLLGLRTLTLQAGDAYGRDFKIPKSSVSILIGSKEVKKLHDVVARNNDVVNVDDQEEEEREYEAMVEGDDDYNDILPKMMEHQCRKSNDRKLICAPVLISTIDYLMKGADWSYGRHLLPQLRLLTADVILDEIDSYDLGDYPAIARLCYLVGIFGRRLILSSATTMPEIFEPLFASYRKGWGSYASLANADQAINLLFASDCVDVENHTVMADEEDTVKIAAGHYEQFAENVAVGLRKKAALRQGEIIPIKYGDDLLEVIFPHTLSLHNKNAVNISSNGIAVSAGLIRLAHTNEVIDLAMQLAKAHERYRQNKVYVKVIPYHSRMMLVIRNHIEQKLDHWLIRKNDVDNFVVSEFVEEAKQAGFSDAMLIVVATPVEEIGRDHDFDWAIIEPSSTRSIAQCAGRVNRHRREELPQDKINIMVLSHPIKYLRKQDINDEAVYRCPGFEITGQPMSCHDMAKIGPLVIKYPGPAGCLSKSPSDDLVRYERFEAIKQRMQVGILSQINGAQFYMTNGHMERYKFRNGRKEPMIYLGISEGYCWKQLFDEQPIFHDFSNLRNTVDNLEATYDGFVIQPTEKVFMSIAEETAWKLHMVCDNDFARKYFSFSVPNWMFDDKTDVVYDPIVGMYKKSKLSSIK